MRYSFKNTVMGRTEISHSNNLNSFLPKKMIAKKTVLNIKNCINTKIEK